MGDVDREELLLTLHKGRRERFSDNIRQVERG
jgi:hypothetical protein